MRWWIGEKKYVYGEYDSWVFSGKLNGLGDGVLIMIYE